MRRFMLSVSFFLAAACNGEGRFVGTWVGDLDCTSEQDPVLSGIELRVEAGDDGYTASLVLDDEVLPLTCTAEKNVLSCSGDDIASVELEVDGDLATLSVDDEDVTCDGEFERE